MPEPLRAVNLGEIADLEMGQSPPSRLVSELGPGVPFLQGNAEFGNSVPESRSFCSDPSKLCREGDVLISVRAPVGDLNLADRVYCIGRGLAAVHFTEIDPAYGWYALQLWARDLDRVAQGSTFAAVGKTQLRNLRLEILPPSEQVQVAEILDTVDQAIRHTEAIIAKLEQVKAGLLHDLLTRGLDENGELRDPDRHPEQFKDSPLGRIPQDWEIRRLPDVAETYAGGTPSRSRPEYFGGKVPWVKSSEVNAAEIWMTEESVTRAGLESSSAKMVPAGTPLIAMYGATAGAVTWLAVPACTNQAVLAAVPKDDVFNRWLYWALYRSSGRLLSSVQGSGQPNLSKTQIDRLTLAVPSQNEQESISRILDAHRRRSTSEGSELDKLRELKVGLMQDLLTGTVRVHVHEAAPAGVS